VFETGRVTYPKSISGNLYSVQMIVIFKIQKDMSATT